MFVRERTNLKVSIQISLVDALAGFRHEIEHLDGHKVRVPPALCVNGCKCINACKTRVPKRR
jgi:DnaJ-class molecular chaperone